MSLVPAFKNDIQIASASGCGLGKDTHSTPFTFAGVGIIISTRATITAEDQIEWVRSDDYGTEPGHLKTRMMGAFSLGLLSSYTLPIKSFPGPLFHTQLLAMVGSV